MNSKGVFIGEPVTKWNGCHGVSVVPDGLGAHYGSMQAVPRSTLHVRSITSTSAVPIEKHEGAVQLWRASVPESGLTEDLWLRPDGSLLVRFDGEPMLVLDATRTTVWIGDILPSVAVQLVATFAIAPAAQAWGALVLHGSALVRQGQAILICGESGVGKSSALVALTDEGWSPLTEDLCALDLSTDPPTAWPGPPWVRLDPSNPPSEGWRELFRTHDKVAWDLGPNRVSVPTPLAHIVILERPEAEADVPTLSGPVGAIDLILLLHDHAPWFDQPQNKAASLFGPIAALATTVPATRLRLQRSPNWRAEATALIDAMTTPS